jgi:hypothetical protein
MRLALLQEFEYSVLAPAESGVKVKELIVFVVVSRSVANSVPLRVSLEYHHHCRTSQKVDCIPCHSKLKFRPIRIC